MLAFKLLFIFAAAGFAAGSSCADCAAPSADDTSALLQAGVSVAKDLEIAVDEIEPPTDEQAAPEEESAELESSMIDTETSGGDKKCAWWFNYKSRGTTRGSKCELKGLRRRAPSEQLICKTSGKRRKGEARKACTGHSGPVSEGDIPNAPYAESFDTEAVLGAWTTKGGKASKSFEKDAQGNWRCMEDKKYNWFDYDDCTAALPSPASTTKHPDDVEPLMICWSCQWIMWYKKEHCACCNPDVLIGEINGEECCDGIDMACGINGHDRRDGTPRGKEVCDDPGKNEVSKTCKTLLATPKPAYSAAAAVQGNSKGGQMPYVHTKADYDFWLNWDPSLCHTMDKKWCSKFGDTCKWVGGVVKKCKSKAGPGDDAYWK